MLRMIRIFNVHVHSFMSRTAITLKFKMCLFLDEASYWAETLLKDINSPHFMSDADNNFGGSLGLDFRKWWRHVHYIRLRNRHATHLFGSDGFRNLVCVFSKAAEISISELSFFFCDQFRFLPPRAVLFSLQIQSSTSSKGRTIRKVMGGGGGGFSARTNFFFRALLV